MRKKNENKRYWHRVESGLCTVCGILPVDTMLSKRRCTQHAKEETIRQTISRNKLVASGKCRTCGKDRGTDGSSKRCRPCLTALSGKHYYKKIADGNCLRCGRKRDIDHNTFCRVCWFKDRSLCATGTIANYKELEAKLIAQDSKCYFTGKQLVIGTNASVDHLTSKYNDKSLESDVNNLVWADLTINTMKNSCNEQEFYTICKLVLEYCKDKIL